MNLWAIDDLSVKSKFYRGLQKYIDYYEKWFWAPITLKLVKYVTNSVVLRHLSGSNVQFFYARLQLLAHICIHVNDDVECMKVALT